MRILFSHIHKIVYFRCRHCCCCSIIRKPLDILNTNPKSPAFQIASLCTTSSVNSGSNKSSKIDNQTRGGTGGGSGNRKQKKLNKKMFQYGNDNVAATSKISEKEYQNLKLRLSSHLRKWQIINSIPSDASTIISQNQQSRNNNNAADNDAVKGQKFKVMSYNILAQDLMEQHLQMYQYHNKNYLNWEYRYRQLMVEIHEMRPDILCLQEVQCDHLPMIKSGLAQLNFEHLYKKRTGTEYSDGCAIFYNKNLFELHQYQNVQFCQPDVQLLNRHNVAIIAKFELVKHPNNFIIVATTHLLYNPNRADVRLGQIQILLSELDRLASINNNNNNNNRSESNVQNNIPIILTGDFNSTQYSAPYKLIANGGLNLKDYETRSLTEIVKPNHSSGTSGQQQQQQQSSSTTDQSSSVRSSNNNNRRPSFDNEYFIPRHLGITDNCQHYGVLIYNQRQHTMLDLPVLSMDRMKPYIEEIEKSTLPFNTGNLRHKLNLKSIFDDGMMCASTFQDEWILVDFIFYSKHHENKINRQSNNKLMNTNTNKNHNNNNKLILLSRYNLPLIINCNEFGTIPNVIYGSDHLAMACEFYLTVTD